MNGGMPWISTPNLSVLSGASLVVGLTRRELVHPAGLPPANSPFEAEDDNYFTTDAEMACRAEARTCGRQCPPTLEASARQPCSRCAASEGWWAATDSHRVLAG